MYKVNATRNDDGSYTLSYGKGSKKLTALLIKVGNVWYADDAKATGTPKTKREAIAAWGAWATSVYGGTLAPASPGQTATTQLDVPHAPPRSGPPKYKPRLQIPQDSAWQPDDVIPAEKPAETRIVEGCDGVRRRLVYGDGGSVIEKTVLTQETPHGNAQPPSQRDPQRVGPPRYHRPQAAQPHAAAAGGKAEAEAADHRAA